MLSSLHPVLRHALFSASLALAPLVPAQAADCFGVVYEDANGNARRDAGEAPVPGVRLSDGERIAAAGADGRYRLAVGDGRTVFVIKPAGYDAPLRTDGLPDTWKSPADSTSKDGSTCDFPLHRAPARPADAELDVLVFGDPQLKSGTDADYYARDILAPPRAAPGATLALSLGDLVNDVPALYPDLKAIDRTLGLPWLHAPGNHDVDPGANADAGSLDAFHAAFGADTYAWEETRANFVVLDDVVVAPGDGKAYIGGLRADQFAFLEGYLAGADRRRLLVVALHVPLFDVGGVETFRHADRARLFALLAPFPHVLVLSAHTHAQQHAWHGPESGWTGATPLHEYNVGAACGAFWSGAKDAAGIPDSTMADGTPNGYARLRVGADGQAALRWFAARAPEGTHMRLHAPRVLRRGAWPGQAVTANVWMGAAATPVAYRIDGGAWLPMKRVLAPDPDLLAENLRDDAAPALRGYDRAPEATASTHLWRGTLPTDLALGEHAIEVRATLPDTGDVTALTRYSLVDAAP
jgi:hypothetical protein